MPKKEKQLTKQALQQKAKEEQALKKELLANVHKIGKSRTKYTLLGTNEAPDTRKQINKYRRKISHAVILNDADFKLHGYQKILREKELKEEEEQNRQIALGLEGTGKLIPSLVFPFVGTMIALYRRERVVHNLLKIGIALVIMASVALAITFLPALSVPFIAFVSTLFGKTAALTAAVVGFGVAFNLAERVLDQVQPLPDRVLRIWKRYTFLDEDTVTLMQHYLRNVIQTSNSPAIKNVLRSLATQDMLNPVPDSLQKIATFFIRQLMKLRNEKRNLEAIKSKNSENYKKNVALWDEKYAQVELDIKAVTFILEQLFSIPSMPTEAQKRIQERLEDTDKLHAARKRQKALAAQTPHPNAAPSPQDRAPSPVAKPYVHLSEPEAPAHLAWHNDVHYVKGIRKPAPSLETGTTKKTHRKRLRRKPISDESGSDTEQ